MIKRFTQHFFRLKILRKRGNTFFVNLYKIIIRYTQYTRVFSWCARRFSSFLANSVRVFLFSVFYEDVPSMKKCLVEKPSVLLKSRPTCFARRTLRDFEKSIFDIIHRARPFTSFSQKYFPLVNLSLVIGYSK
jgi:hypothetical protein